MWRRLSAHSVQSTRLCERGREGGGDSRPHSVQSTRPCEKGGVWRRLLASLSPVHSFLRRGGVEANLGLTQSSPLVPAEGGCVEATLGLTQSSPLIPAKKGVWRSLSPGLTQSSLLAPAEVEVWRRLSASLSPVHS